MAAIGEFEILILMAVLRLDHDAYAPAVRAEIEQRTGRGVSRGAVYITLDRLEEKGLLASKPGDSLPSRGGRPRRLFHVTALGVRSVKHAVAMLTRMHKGLESLLGDL